MAKRRDLSSGWKTYKVLEKDGHGVYTVTPFSDCLAVSGVAAKQATTKMQIVQDLGWPEAKRQLKDNIGRARIVKKDDKIWLQVYAKLLETLFLYRAHSRKEDHLCLGDLQANR